VTNTISQLNECWWAERCAMRTGLRSFLASRCQDVCPGHRRGAVRAERRHSRIDSSSRLKQPRNPL
jgi:hypothetical protein